MRILFDNLFRNSSFSSTNGSLNYPASNLAHPFLRRRFQSISTSSVITASFTTDQTFDSFYYGFFNLTSLSVEFKNSIGTVLRTINITSPEDIGAEHFSQTGSVRSVDITVSGPSGFYLGGIGGGLSYQMIEPVAAYDPSFDDNSSFAESPQGQTLQNFITPLRELEFSFRDVTGTIYQEVSERYKSVGVGLPLWIDLFEDNRDKEPPLYGKIISSPSFPYADLRHAFTLSFREAR